MWIVGAGPMALEYAKVMQTLGTPFIVIGRSEPRVEAFKQNISCDIVSGGLAAYIEQASQIPKQAILAVPVEVLHQESIRLLKAGVKEILVEKPAGLNLSEVESIASEAEKHGAAVYVAYNRRFFASVLKLKEKLKDEKLLSCNFEFTEWAHVIEKLDKPKAVLNRWLWANSSHVIDLAFHISGRPAEKSPAFISSPLKWHPSGGCFAGSGVTENSVLYSYKANWCSAGRWSLEFLTEKGRYLLEPMEQLQFQPKGTIKLENVSLDTEKEQALKPGLLAMVEDFLTNKSFLPDIYDQIAFCKECDHIGGY